MAKKRRKSRIVLGAAVTIIGVGAGLFFVMKHKADQETEEITTPKETETTKRINKIHAKSEEDLARSLQSKQSADEQLAAVTALSRKVPDAPKSPTGGDGTASDTPTGGTQEASGQKAPVPAPDDTVVKTLKAVAADESKDPIARSQAQKTLAELEFQTRSGEERIALARDFLENGSPGYRMAALAVLADAGGDEFTALLLQTRKSDPDENVRLFAETKLDTLGIEYDEDEEE